MLRINQLVFKMHVLQEIILDCNEVFSSLFLWHLRKFISPIEYWFSPRISASIYMLLPGIVSLLFLFSRRLVANLEFCFWLGVSNWFSSGASNSVNMLLCFQVPWYVVLCHGLGEKYYCTLVCSFGVLLLNTFTCLTDMTLVCVVVTFICVIHKSELFWSWDWIALVYMLTFIVIDVINM
jgi:hypothetical protein